MKLPCSTRRQSSQHLASGDPPVGFDTRYSASAASFTHSVRVDSRSVEVRHQCAASYGSLDGTTASVTSPPKARPNKSPVRRVWNGDVATSIVVQPHALAYAANTPASSAVLDPAGRNR